MSRLAMDAVGGLLPRLSTLLATYEPALDTLPTTRARQRIMANINRQGLRRRPWEVAARVATFAVGIGCPGFAQGLRRHGFAFLRAGYFLQARPAWQRHSRVELPVWKGVRYGPVIRMVPYAKPGQIGHSRKAAHQTTCTG